MKKWVCLMSAVAGEFSALAGELPLSGSDYWAGIPRHPAVVNPVVGSGCQDVLSLRGEWQFATNREPWFRVARMCSEFDSWNFRRTIQVPGCWEAQGVGEPGMGIPHLCLDNAPKPIRHKFSGGAWYVKDVVIPPSWKGRRIWLKTGGARGAAWLIWGSNAVARVHNYCGTYKYDVTPFVRFGETNRVIAMVSNQIVPRNAQMNNVNRWGGLWRDVEIEATPSDCFIDDAWVRGDFDRQEAEVHVELGDGAKSKGEGEQRTNSFSLRVTVESATKELVLHRSPSPFTFTLEVPLRNFRPWSPEHPNLYTAKVELASNGRVVQTRYERFGVRKLEVRGREFYLNNRPFFVRGFGDDSTYPITGLSPADKDYHLKHFRVARAAGFNFVRLHTHCEIPEYFEAADEAGIFVQPELSYYMDYPEEDFEYDPLRDYRELHENYRRYPSFAVYSGGNEGVVGPAAGKSAYKMLKKLDPDRLVIEQDGGTHNSAWGRPYDPDRSDYCSGPLNIWQRGSFNARTFVAHEYLNLSVKSDSRWESDFTGVWLPPVTREKRAAWLARFRLGHDWGDRFQDSAHALQKFWQKQGLEAARMDPYCDGYIYWTICDVTVFNPVCETYAAQGWLDPFWRVKKCGATPAEFAVFNSPDCLLLDTAARKRMFVGEHNPTKHERWKSIDVAEETNRVYEAGQTIPVEFLFAHYGNCDFTAAVLRWRLETDGRVLVSGERPVGRCTVGPARSLGSFPIVVPALERPVRATLAAEVIEGGKSVRNSWDFWLFPARRVRRVVGVAASESIRKALSPWFAGLLPCDDDGVKVAIVETGSDEEKAALQRGLSVVSLTNQTGKANIFLGWWSIGSQVGTGFKEHPALKDLPYDAVLTPLWFRLIKEGTKLPVADVVADDLVIAGEGGDACYLYLSDGISANGAHRVRVSGLDLLSGLPEGNLLLANILTHCGGCVN